MRNGNGPTLWSSWGFFFLCVFACFSMQAQCLKEATMSVITQRFFKDQPDMAKNSPQITSARCFKMIDACSAAL